MLASARADLRRPYFAWRSASRPVSLRVERRTIWVCAALIGVILLASLVSLAVGTYQLSLSDVLGALVGRGDRRATTLVLEWRLPRVLFAIACGAALALGGAIFQSLTRNPLGSPDVIGFDAGSYTGALVVMLVLKTNSYAMLALGSVVGGLATAAVVYLLAYRRGVQGFRLIIVGIGVGAMLSSLNTYLLIRSGTETAMMATAWGVGSLSALGMAQLVPFVVVFVLLLPALGAVAGPLQQLELGDDAARALGVRAEPVRASASVAGVACTALVTAAAGPIAFIALVAPQISRRITRASGLGLPAAALVGSALLLMADFIAQRIAVATGLVTVSLGGLYFIWLLVREYRHS